MNNPIIYSDPNGNVFQFAVAGAYGAYTAVAVEAGAANFWNPVGWTILGISAVATVAIISYSYYQGDRVFIQGPWNGYSIQMWVNTVKKIIESAWPKY